MFAGQRMCDMDFGLVEAQPKKERKKECSELSQT